MYRECLLQAIPRYLWSVLLKGVVGIGSARSDGTSFAMAPCRIETLVQATGLLTKDLEAVDLWHIKIATDTSFIRSAGATLRKRLPSDVRALILEFGCDSDLRELHRNLCRTKSYYYHVLAKPLFWHCLYDAQSEDTCHQMIGVYIHTVRGLHQPKLNYLTRALIKHRGAAGEAFCNLRREWCNRSVEICDLASRMRVSNDHPLSTMLQGLYS